MSRSSATADMDRYEAPFLLVFCTAVGISVLGGRWLPHRWPVLPLAFAAMAIAVWHGAFDNALAEEHFESRWGALWRPSFYFLYAALAVLVVCLWWASPVVALSAFLLYSGVHFGTEMDRKLSVGRLIVAMAAGSLPIAAACHWWPAVVSSIFATMLRREGRLSDLVTITAGHLLWPAVLVASVGILGKRPLRLNAAVLMVAELVLFRFCSPVPAFAVFFCLWHTPEHMLSTSLSLAGTFDAEKLRRHLQKGLLPWLLSLTGFVVLCWLGRHAMQAYSAAFFVFLSAVTVPHMVLAEVCRRGQRAVPDDTKVPFTRQETVNAHSI